MKEVEESELAPHPEEENCEEVQRPRRGSGNGEKCTGYGQKQRKHSDWSRESKGENIPREHIKLCFVGHYIWSTAYAECVYAVHMHIY